MKNLHTGNCAEIKESPLVRNDKLEFNPRFPSKNTTIGSIFFLSTEFNRINSKKIIYNVFLHTLNIQKYQVLLLPLKSLTCYLESKLGY